MKNVKIIYRCEYFDARLGTWICMVETLDVDKARSFLNHPICGNPSTRLVKDEKSGVRKIKYKLLEVLEKKIR